MTTSPTPNAAADIIIIGSGIGGATIAAGLAGSGARITILEAGDHLADRPENRDPRAIFQRGFFRPKESWYDESGKPFKPGNYYNVGGNSKFYGAVLTRYRAEDFAEMQHLEGVSPAWPFAYEELEPWYSKAEQLFQVRGTLGEDPTEPFHSAPYNFPPVPDEAPIAALRSRLKKVGVHPASLPLGVDIDTWLKHGKTPWDAHPNSFNGKMDAETTALAAARKHENVRLETNARVTRLETAADGKSIAAVHYEQNGARHIVRPKLVVLSAGAVQSAVLLLRSADDANPAGLSNRSDQVGRNFMNHNLSAVIGFDPRFKNDSVYQKTFGFNDFYLSDGDGGAPLGNVQLLGRISGAVLKSDLRMVPEWALDRFCAHTVDFLAMSEDVPKPESRVRIDGDRIILEWIRSNWPAHLRLVARIKSTLRAAGFPLVLSKAFDRKTPSHQCGTVRMGSDPATAPLDIYCRAFDHPNLFVVDAAFLPTSAAVNPALTIAAQALRVADNIVRKELS
ncbi:NAD(P)-binding protein [Phyllobacterium sp. SYP-B3895]|uniref:GMC oxidoreductase n=1 Tax=Phyllobacterium sp. SYP-B3895 TaxID=2663240 RepID=UPI0012997126|nr:GMC family oxidoreductase [Phyllobacterium sp. SYP-B3895]MRG54450.1 NAD(P)-binding protein [Phyllobacterium sp. SYP-B3895]